MTRRLRDFCLVIIFNPSFNLQKRGPLQTPSFPFRSPLSVASWRKSVQLYFDMTNAHVVSFVSIQRLQEYFDSGSESRRRGPAADRSTLRERSIAVSCRRSSNLLRLISRRTVSVGNIWMSSKRSVAPVLRFLKHPGISFSDSFFNPFFSSSSSL